MKTSKFKRTLFISFAAIFVSLVAVAAFLPLFIKVDRFRPQLVRLANEKIEGKLELGKLSLSFWGKISVGIEKAELFDKNQKEVLSVGSFELAVPLMKLITGRPEIEIRMQKPTLNVVREKDGTWNFVELVKKEETPAQAPRDEKAPSLPATQEEFPQWVRRTGVSLAIEKANLKVLDVKEDAEYQLNSVSLKTGLLSLEEFPHFVFSADLNTRLGKSGRLEGPFQISGKTQGKDLKIEADFQKIALLMGEGLGKKAGTPAKIACLISQSAEAIRLKNGEALWENAKASFEGEIEKPKEGIPAQGKFSLNLAGVPFRGPYFKQALEFSGEVQATLDSVEKAVVQVQAKGFDLTVTSSIRSFSAPQAKVQILSKEMDLDQLIDWKAMKEASLAHRSQKPSSPTSNPPPQVSSPSKGESPAKKAVGEILVNLESIKAYNIFVKPVRGKFKLQNLKLIGSFDPAKLLNGQLELSVQADATGEELKYSFQTRVKDLSLQEAVSSQVEWLKNTLTGSLSGEMTGTGQGMEAEKAKKALKAQGRALVKPARLSTIDVNQMISQGLNGALSKAGEKVPGLQGKTLKMDSVASEFQQVTSSFTLSDGFFNSPDFYAQAVPNKGVELQGKTRVGLVDYEVEADWEVSDPYNVLKMKELSLEQKGFKVDSVLVERGKPFRIPIHVRGSLFKPEYNYGSIPEFLVGIALKNLSLAAEDRAKGELKKQAQEKLKEVTEKAPPQVQQILKGIFK